MLRRAQLETVLRGVAGEKRVALYVLVGFRQDAAPRLASAQALATRRGWTVADRTFDVTGPTDPATRPQLARLLAAARRGEIHGILAASRVDISDNDREYEAMLEQIRTLGAGLALAREENVL
ncbi:MAG TPA: recombinase family protein [Streptomyces sp.]|uniref:recombinase family protein n=1 Tax=Streptomyces sp. TaxID=1931 RepID=UPI002BA070DD|nr:recombinase family protein [Streptomyces sp.]HWU11132.1 recombinase family protein [Streptomyces sp.]